MVRKTAGRYITDFAGASCFGIRLRGLLLGVVAPFVGDWLLLLLAMGKPEERINVEFGEVLFEEGE